MRLLFGAEDSAFLDEVQTDLIRQGFQVNTCAAGSQVLERCRDVDAILLDLVLSDIDGFEVCRAVRAVCPVPIIMVSSRGDEFDRVLSLKLGADDYVSRPYSVRELTARIEAVIRRSAAAWRSRAIERGDSDTREVGQVRISFRSRTVTVAGRPTVLTRMEFDILVLLSSDPGRVFGREEIMTEVWGHDGAGDTRTLGVHISGLRKKLGTPNVIETVRGVGFRLIAEDDQLALAR
ncbi:MAG TPA: response regulator transcription factor [Jatrophihabitans sp.]|jgi:DNA-binding response OmpR family regulator|nr:response regulator transcription factor [Jatrophihabitans sp.]